MKTIAWISLCLLTSFLMDARAEEADDYLLYTIPANAEKGDSHPSAIESDEVQFDYFIKSGDVGRQLVAVESYFKTTLVARALYKDGEEHGVQREWYRNGQLRSEAPYKERVMHGIFRHWDETGQLVGQYQMVNGTGTKRIYDSTGILIREEVYENNHESGLYMSLSSAPDNVRSLLWFKNGNRIAKSFSFYGDDTLRTMTYSPVVGPTHGLRIEFSKDGRVTNKMWFVKGQIVSETEYASAAADDPTLPYYSNAAKYKELLDADTLALVKKYRSMPKVKIPLEFDERGNPIPQTRKVVSPAH